MDIGKQIEQALPVIERWLAYNVYADQRIPGLSVGIVHRDRVLLSTGYGYADKAQQRTSTEKTCYRIASFSKIFTTIAIMQLVEQRKIRLDEYVVSYLPWFHSDHDPHLGHITVRQLLTHTSGLERDGDTPYWIDFQFPELEHIQQYIQKGATVYSPLEQWRYSNYGFALLGEIIRQVGGEDYKSYVNSMIIERLALTHTAPEVNDVIAPHLALGYSRTIPYKEKESFPTITTQSMAPATGFVSNVVDICRLIQAQFEGNTEVLSDESKREMRRIQWLREDEEGVDWCIGLETWKVNERRIYGHGGGFPGYKSRFGFDPEQRVGVVLLANAIDAPSAHLVDGVWKILDYVITQSEELHQKDTASHVSLEEYALTFSCIWEEAEFVVVGEQLLLYTPGPDAPVTNLRRLRYEREDQFRIVSGNNFGSVFGELGEMVRFIRKDDKISKVYIGANLYEHLTRL